MSFIRNTKVVRMGGLIIAGAALVPAAMAAAGAPLPRCAASEQAFYLTRYTGPASTGRPPTAVLDLATVPATGSVAISQIWSGAAAPTVSPREISLTPPNPPLPAGASVAGGMGKDGYIYSMRAVDGDNNWDTSPAAGWSSAAGGGWRSHTRYYEMLRYGRDGVVARLITHRNQSQCLALTEYHHNRLAFGLHVRGAPDAQTIKSTTVRGETGRANPRDLARYICLGTFAYQRFCPSGRQWRHTSRFGLAQYRLGQRMAGAAFDPSRNGQ